MLCKSSSDHCQESSSPPPLAEREHVLFETGTKYKVPDGAERGGVFWTVGTFGIRTLQEAEKSS